MDCALKNEHIRMIQCLKIGETFDYTNSSKNNVTLEVAPIQTGCMGCYFNRESEPREVCAKRVCFATERNDGVHVIYKEVKNVSR